MDDNMKKLIEKYKQEMADLESIIIFFSIKL